MVFVEKFKSVKFSFPPLHSHSSAACFLSETHKSASSEIQHSINNVTSRHFMFLSTDVCFGEYKLWSFPVTHRRSSDVHTLFHFKIIYWILVLTVCVRDENRNDEIAFSDLNSNLFEISEEDEGLEWLNVMSRKEVKKRGFKACKIELNGVYNFFLLWTSRLQPKIFRLKSKLRWMFYLPNL